MSTVPGGQGPPIARTSAIERVLRGPARCDHAEGLRRPACPGGRRKARDLARGATHVCESWRRACSHPRELRSTWANGGSLLGDVLWAGTRRPDGCRGKAIHAARSRRDLWRPVQRHSDRDRPLGRSNWRCSRSLARSGKRAACGPSTAATSSDAQPVATRVLSRSLQAFRLTSSGRSLRTNMSTDLIDPGACCIAPGKQSFSPPSVGAPGGRPTGERELCPQQCLLSQSVTRAQGRPEAPRDPATATRPSTQITVGERSGCG